MTAPRFLLVGAASELSLRPLAAVLARRGLPVTLVDLADEPVLPSSAPPGDGPLVLVTSQHLAMTGDVYDRYSAITTHVASPQALKLRLGADLLVYVPHDLADPVLSWETSLLPLLDLYVAPDDSTWWACAHVPTVVAGWVGSADLEGVDVPQRVVDRGILFVSSVRWILSRGGGPFLVDWLRRTLGHGLAVKLPHWPGMEGLEEALRGAGAEMVEPTVNAAALIARAPLVVTTAAGGIVAEAARAGHRPICVLPPVVEPGFLADLATYDVLTCSDEEFPEAVHRAGVVRPSAAAFDIDAFLSAVDDRLEALRRD